MSSDEFDEQRISPESLGTDKNTRDAILVQLLHAGNTVHRRYKTNDDRFAVHKDYTNRTRVPGREQPDAESRKAP